MKSVLNKKQLVEMYKPRQHKKQEITSDNPVRAQATRDMIIIETVDAKHQVVSFSAYQKMLEENVKLKTEIKDLYSNISRIIQSHNRLSTTVNKISEELEKKIDKE